MIYVPDPEPLDYSMSYKDVLYLDPFRRGKKEPYIVYYVGEYPAPHFEEEEYTVVEKDIGLPILGLYDEYGHGQWVGQADAYNNRELFRKPRP